MPAKKKRSAKISKHKQNISAQTRVKLSQAAKRRTRFKGRFGKGSFAAEGPKKRQAKKARKMSPPRSQSPQELNKQIKRDSLLSQRRKPSAPGKGRAGEARLKKGQTKGGAPEQAAQSHLSGMSTTEFKGELQASVDKWQKAGLSRGKAEEAARLELAQRPNGKLAAVTDFDRPPTFVRSTDIAQIEKARRESNWKSGEGLYRTRYAQTRREKDALNLSEMMGVKSKAGDTVGLLPAEHKAEVEKLLNDPNSNFNKGLDPTRPHTGRAKYGRQRHRLERYSLNLQQGMSHEQAYHQLAEETRGKSSTTKRQIEREAGTRAQDAPIRRNKFSTQVSKETGRGFGVDIPAADSVAALQSRFPDMSERDILRVQQSQKETYYDQFQKNSRWAHETKRANITGGKGDVSQSNKVTFFTTSLGTPTASVPADSLIGQYIIRKRKKVLRKEGWDSRRLAGKFPNDVRDMHIIEAGAGRSLGAYGNVGVYKQGGWRAGNKRSPGFGKRAPVGSSILTDSQGRPVYDTQGNVVYSPGAERPFKLGTKDQLGARVFLG